ncbi:MAG: uracil-DNA glycosylase [Alphaproteobacteria bacterium]|nr:uracil-DNA glycosylase [Alphaproteobacteria bacterium]
MDSIVPAYIPARFNGLILVGEAPGAEEARQGKPFVGRSGQLLNDQLKAVGIDRAQCVVANVFRVQPPKNNVGFFFSSRRAAVAAGQALADDLPPFGSARLLAAWRGELMALAATIADFPPKTIVALGRTPLWALTGQNGLLQNVGQFLPCTLVRGARVLATYHPSYILRGNWKLVPTWQQHFAQAL